MSHCPYLAFEPAELFRVYDPEECGKDGYPFAWHKPTQAPPEYQTGLPQDGPLIWEPVKNIVRANAGDRCLRCGHPYSKGAGEWSPCDELCTHGVGPTFTRARGEKVEAAWRILTVHHLLTGQAGKRNLLWWNLVSLCQRCHLTIQRRVDLRRVYPWPHSDWFRPYAAGWYAFAYLGEELSRVETLERLDDLLALEAAG